MQQEEMSLGSSSSLILTIITMSIWCEFMAAHPQHSSSYPLASNSSSSCSSLSSCTFPGLTQIHSFLFTITTFSLYSPALTQVPPAALALRKAAVLMPRRQLHPRAPPCFSLRYLSSLEEAFWEQPMQTWTHPPLKSFQTPSCRECYKTLAVDQGRQVTSRLCPSSSCLLPGSCCALRPTSTAN